MIQSLVCRYSNQILLLKDPADLGSILAFNIVFFFFPCLERKKVSGAIPAINAMYSETNCTFANEYLYFNKFREI